MVIQRSKGAFRGGLIPVLFALGLCGCTYIRAVTQTNVPRVRSHPVEVDVKRDIFFGTFDTDDAVEATKRLQEKCPGGRVVGITTKDLRTLYFLFIYWAREVQASGFCVKPNMADQPQRDGTSGLALEAGDL